MVANGRTPQKDNEKEKKTCGDVRRDPAQEKKLEDGYDPDDQEDQFSSPAGEEN